MPNPTHALGWLRSRTQTRLVGRLTSDSSWAACGESTVTEAGIDMAQTSLPTPTSHPPGGGGPGWAGRINGSAVANPRIDIRVHQVCQQVDDDERDGEQEHDALHHGVVARADRVDQEAADAWPGEDRLGQHG